WVVSGSFKLMPPEPSRITLAGEPTLTRGVTMGLRTLSPLQAWSIPGLLVQLAAVRLLLQTAISVPVGSAPPIQAVGFFRLLLLLALTMSAPDAERAPTRKAQTMAAVKLESELNEGEGIFIGYA